MAIKIKGDTIINNEKEWDDNHLIPSGDNQKNLGSASKRWKNAYIGNDLTVGDDLTVGEESTFGDNVSITGDLLVDGDLNVDDGDLNISRNLDVSLSLAVGGPANIPKMMGRGFARPFSMKKSGNEELLQEDGDWNHITSWTVEFDGTVESGYGCYNNGYEVPEDGIYQFGFNIATEQFSEQQDAFHIKLGDKDGFSRNWYHDFNDMYGFKGGMMGSDDNNTETHTFSGTALFNCSRGDYIRLYYTTYESGNGRIKDGGSSTFWGHMVAPGNGKESQLSEGGH